MSTWRLAMASRGGDMGSLLILRATGDGESGALGGRWEPAFGTVKCDRDLYLKNIDNVKMILTRLIQHWLQL